MKRQLLYSSLLLLLAGSSCKKDAPDASLPPETHTGANTAGCLINGQPFVATGYGSGLGKTQGMGGGFAYDSAFYLRLNGKLGDQNGSLHLFLNSIPRRSSQALVKTYLLNQLTPVMPAVTPDGCENYAVFFSNDGSRELYVTNTQYTGAINLTYANLSSLVAAGTFEFTAVSNRDPGKIIRVTAGRFDRKQ